jgi:micrococcal nuclease
MRAAIVRRLLRHVIPLSLAGLVACGAIEASDATAADSLPHSNQAVNFILEGSIGAIEDGDTLTLVTKNKTRFIIRLSDIDTPEIFHKGGPDRMCPGRVLPDRPGQPLGRAARSSLSAIAGRKQARAECYEIDRFGRPVCHVFIGKLNVNREQVERGWGMLSERAEWVRDPESRDAEARARARGAGVWQLRDPLHPARWRDRCWTHGQCAGAES